MHASSIETGLFMEVEPPKMSAPADEEKPEIDFLLEKPVPIVVGKRSLMELAALSLTIAEDLSS